MRLSHEIAELSAVVQQTYAALLEKRYQEVIFHDLAHRGLGRDLIAVCPFHQGDTTPSLHILGDSPVWRCLAGCGSGTWISYLQRKDGRSFWEALDKLTLAAQIDLRHYPHYERWKRECARAEMYEKVLRYSRDQLHSQAGSSVRAYLEQQRKLSPQQMRALELGAIPDAQELFRFIQESGFDPDLAFGSPRDGRPGAFNQVQNLGSHRVVVPFRDEIGRIFTLFTRVTPSSEPKVLEKYRPISAMTDERDLLFNLWTFDATDTVILVEGSFDASRASLAGIRNVAATNGVEVRPAHLDILQRRKIRKVMLVPDTDKIGQERAAQSVDALASHGFEVWMVDLPVEFKDLDSLLSELGAVGVEIFSRCLRTARRAMEWRAQKLVNSLPQERSAHTRTALEYAAKISRTEDAVEFLHEIVRLGVASVSDLQRALEALRKEKLPEILKSQYLAASSRALSALRDGRSADFEADFLTCKQLLEKLS